MARPAGSDEAIPSGGKRTSEGKRPRALRGLDEREARIAALVAAGRSDVEIAVCLAIGVGDVQAALGVLFGKLRLRSRTELALLAADAATDGTRWTPSH